jgi:HSP20 family protein
MAEKRDTGGRKEHSQGERGLQRSEGRNSGLSARRDPFDLFGFGPFGMMRRMQEDMDRLFGGFGGGRAWPALAGEGERIDWAPAVEAFQRGNEFVVRADVPGLSRDDLSVEIGDDQLTIRGERAYDHDEEREGVFRSERAYGSFCRVIPLPEGAVGDSATANFKDGVLEIVVQAPSQEVRRGRRVEIGQASQESKESKERTQQR